MKAIIKEKRSNARQPDKKELVETLNIVGKESQPDGADLIALCEREDWLTWIVHYVPDEYAEII